MESEMEKQWYKEGYRGGGNVKLCADEWVRVVMNVDIAYSKSFLVVFWS